MARPLRIVCPIAWYHVTARGNERRDIFRDDKDRFRFLEIVAEMIERFEIRLHAYVLMGNHYHLLLEICRPNLSQAIQWLNVSYSVWFNRRHSRAGHLFQGRFKSIAVEPRTWGLSLSAYIHLNPVRVAALGLHKRDRQHAAAVAIDRPNDDVLRRRMQILRTYRWSSYRAYVGAAKEPEWLRCVDVLSLGGGSIREQRANYRRYVEKQVRDGVAKSPWEELTDQVLLGSARFLRKLQTGLKSQSRLQWASKSIRKTLTFEDVVAAVEKVRGEQWEAFRDRHGDRGRDQALYLARRATPLSLSALAQAAGLNQHAGVAVAVKRYGRDAQQNPTERKLLKQAAELLQIK
jgi:REP element-mobilizing transposase RayT